MTNEDERMEEDKPDASSAKAKPKKVYIPGVSRALKEGEQLEVDESAYHYFHQFETDHPCLTFDPIVDDEGVARAGYPLHCYLLCGTQADKIRDNSIIVMKLANINSTGEEDDEESSSDEDAEDSDDEEEKKGKDPVMFSVKIAHHGGINRIRQCRLSPTSLICAVWNDTSKVQIWNVNPCLQELTEMTAAHKPTKSKDSTANANPSKTLKKEKPLYSFAGHPTEGFAVDWSPLKPGRLLTGDCRGNIYSWHMAEGAQWAVDAKPYAQHSQSVEDIQWSPAEESVFASCSVDRSIRLWDARLAPAQANVVTVADAHEKDVNVMSWNHVENTLLVSGADDGVIKIWDLRHIQQQQAVAVFKHHTAPITSVHWYPHESTVFAASGEDDQTTIWDLALEPDDPTQLPGSEAAEAELGSVPPQLLFVHQGQKQVKEVRWHANLAGGLLTTSLSGFDLFRTISI